MTSTYRRGDRVTFLVRVANRIGDVREPGSSATVTGAMGAFVSVEWGLEEGHVERPLRGQLADVHMSAIRPAT